MSLFGYAYGDSLAKGLSFDTEIPQQIYWTLWYLFLLLIVGRALAYWLGSGISTDYDQEMIENCIQLFCTENLSE